MLKWNCFLRVSVLWIIVFHEVTADYHQKIIHHKGKRCYTKKCDKHQTFRRCETDLGQDECIDCPLNYFNCEVIDTVSENAANLVRTDMLDEICVKNPTCLPGSILKEGDICRYMETGDYCECDRKNLFIGDDWNTCTVIKSMALKSCIQQQGQELKQNGTVGPCDEGFYKNKEDLSTCKRWTQCARDNIKTLGTKTTDTICKNVTDVVVSSGSESTTSISEDALIGAAIIGVSAVIFIVLTIYIKYRSKFSGFFRNLKGNNPENKETESESTRFLHTDLPKADNFYDDIERRIQQRNSLHCQSMEETRKKQELSESDTDVKTENSRGNEKEVMHSMENGKADQTHEVVCSHQTVPKSFQESIEINTQVNYTVPNGDSERFIPYDCDARDEHYRKFYCKKPIAKVQPRQIKQEDNRKDELSDNNRRDEPSEQRSIDSIHLASAPPLSSLVGRSY